MSHDITEGLCAEAPGDVGHPLVRRVAALSGTSYFLEPDWLARFPISPASAPRGAEAADLNSSQSLDLEFGEIGWRMAAPAGAKSRATSTTFALDVYHELTARLAAAGYPEDGRVEFSAYSLLHQVGRVPPATRNRTAVVSPNGSAYQDLRRALDHLSGSTFSYRVGEAAVSAGSLPPPEFRILSEYGLAGESGGFSYVRFSGGFMTQLLTAPRLVFMDRWLHRTLSAGVPRALYRLLAAEYPNRRVSYGGLELLQRLGSTQRASSGSRLTQRLARAHEELLKREVLVREPEIRKSGGVWRVTYDLAGRGAPWLDGMSWGPRYLIGGVAREESLHDNLALLAVQASSYGVRREMAVDLARANPRALARTLAATALDILWPEKGLPHMIVRYARNDHPIVDRRGRIRPRKAEEGGTTGASYLIQTAVERRRRMAAAREGRSDRSVAWIPHAAGRIVLELGAGHEPWVAEGLEAILAQLHFELPGYSPS